MPKAFLFVLMQVFLVMPLMGLHIFFDSLHLFFNRLSIGLLDMAKAMGSVTQATYTDNLSIELSTTKKEATRKPRAVRALGGAGGVAGKTTKVGRGVDRSE